MPERARAPAVRRAQQVVLGGVALGVVGPGDERAQELQAPRQQAAGLGGLARVTGDLLRRLGDEQRPVADVVPRGAGRQRRTVAADYGVERRPARRVAAAVALGKRPEPATRPPGATRPPSGRTPARTPTPRGPGTT